MLPQKLTVVVMLSTSLAYIDSQDTLANLAITADKSHTMPRCLQK